MGQNWIVHPLLALPVSPVQPIKEKMAHLLDARSSSALLCFFFLLILLRPSTAPHALLPKVHTSRQSFLPFFESPLPPPRDEAATASTAKGRVRCRCHRQRDGAGAARPFPFPSLRCAGTSKQPSDGLGGDERFSSTGSGE
jgi:hypothetical protein